MVTTLFDRQAASLKVKEIQYSLQCSKHSFVCIFVFLRSFVCSSACASRGLLLSFFFSDALVLLSLTPFNGLTDQLTERIPYGTLSIQKPGRVSSPPSALGHCMGHLHSRRCDRFITVIFIGCIRPWNISSTPTRARTA